MTVPHSFTGTIDDVSRRLGKTDDVVLAVFLKVQGSVEGAMMLIFPNHSALSFLKLLNGKEEADLRNLDEEDLSALREVGNILLGASLTALNKFLNLNLIASIPDVAIDMLGAIMDSALVELGSESEEVLMFNIDLAMNHTVEGDLYFMFDPKSSKKLLEATNNKMNGNA